MMSYTFILLWILNVLSVSVKASPLPATIQTNQNSTTLNNDTYLGQYFRPTWIEVHLDGVRSNVRELKKYIGDDVHLMAIVKGDAYGFGAVELAEISISAGATWLGVATLDEALFLRNTIQEFVPILVLGYVDPKDLSVVSRHRITVTAVSLEWVKEADEMAEEPFDFHLKLDTGMNRIGCKTIEEVESVIEIISQSPFLNWTGAFTHFASSSNLTDTSFFHQQLDLFQEFLGIIPQVENKIIHCANSGATLLHSVKPFFNMVRLGTALIGLVSNPPIPLQRVYLPLYSNLLLAKQLEVGERVGYDGAYTTTQKQWIGTIPIGYADAFQLRFSVNAVLVDGERVPIVALSMDSMMVALPSSYPVGTLVTFINRAANETLSTGTFPTAESRVPRLYFLNGSLVRIRNPILESINLM